jgi:lipid-A-disaccharide synthase
MVVKVPHIAMSNLIAGKRVVPELIQNQFTASNIVSELQVLLPDGPHRQSMMEGLAAIRGRLGSSGNGDGAIGRVAEITLGLLGTGLLEPAVPAVLEQAAHS